MRWKPLPKRRDLFSPPVGEENKRSICGFLPMGGWMHKWAYAAHRDNCDDCLRIEGDGKPNNRERKQ